MDTSESIIEVNEYEIDLTEGSQDYQKIAGLRARAWEKQVFRPQGAWLYSTPNGTGRSKGSPDQPLDPEFLVSVEANEAQYVEGGWDSEHCAVCGQRIAEDDPLFNEGFTDGKDWICDDCERLFVNGEAVFASRMPAEVATPE
jgi:hypothetical protein